MGETLSLRVIKSQSTHIKGHTSHGFNYECLLNKSEAILHEGLDLELDMVLILYRALFITHLSCSRLNHVKPVVNSRGNRHIGRTTCSVYVTGQVLTGLFPGLNPGP